jgi:hypothetical protein
VKGEGRSISLLTAKGSLGHLHRPPRERWSFFHPLRVARPIQRPATGMIFECHWEVPEGIRREGRFSARPVLLIVWNSNGSGPKRAKPAVASRVQRRVRPRGCSEALGRVACPKFMAMKKVDAERTSSFASGCGPAGQLSGSSANSRSSCEQRQALAIFAAHWTAASRDGSSRTQKPPSNSLVCG